MNGALFGTYKVILNTMKMVSCGRNDHPWWRQCLMVLFMLYLVTLYLLQFLTVGAMFITIMVFFNQLFKIAFYKNTTSETLQDIYEEGIF